MTVDQAIILGSVIIAVIVVVVIPIITTIKDIKKNGPLKERVLADEGARLNKEAEIQSFHAEVIDMACGVHTEGRHAYRLTETVKEFYVKFRDDDGEIYDILVNESIYEGFEIGQSGTLTLVDGRIDGFEVDDTTSV